MTIELLMLLYSTILLFVLIAIPATESILKNGVAAQASSRDSLPDPTVFNKRAVRLRNNMLENMALFIPLVVIVTAVGGSSEQTAMGAQVFFYARLAHAVVYLGGWPWIRPLFWFAGVVGLILMALPLL